MSLFQCENCGCVENTALSLQGFQMPAEWFDWTGIEHLKGKRICSACGPARHSDGDDTECGKWHGQFPRKFLPPGMFKTNGEGNLAHVETGSTDYSSFVLKEA